MKSHAKKQMSVHRPKKQRCLLSMYQLEQPRLHRSSSVVDQTLTEIATALTKHVPLTGEDTRRRSDFCKSLQTLLRYLSSCNERWSDRSYENRLLLRQIHNLLVLSVSYHCRLLQTTNEPQKSRRILSKLHFDCLSKLYENIKQHVLSESYEQLREIAMLYAHAFIHLLSLQLESSENEDRSSQQGLPSLCELITDLAALLTTIIGELQRINSEKTTLPQSLPCFVHSSDLIQLMLEHPFYSGQSEQLRHALSTLFLRIRNLTQNKSISRQDDNPLSTLGFPWVHAAISECDLTVHEVLSRSLFSTRTSYIDDETWKERLRTLLLSNPAYSSLDGDLLRSRQIKSIVSVLLRRVFLSFPLDEQLVNSDTHFLQHDCRRHIVRTLLPLLSLLLENPLLTNVPAGDWIAICQVLLESSDDENVIHDTARMVCALIRRQSAPSNAQTSMYCRDLVFENNISLLNSLAGVIAHNTPTTHSWMTVQECILSALDAVNRFNFRNLPAVWWNELARQSNIIAAVIRGLSSGSSQTRRCAAALVWRLSNPAANYRILARHPGAIASMIRLVRQAGQNEFLLDEPASLVDEMDECSTMFAIGREAWKERISQLTQAL